MPNCITLQVVMDDSDPMSDYYAPDRPLYKWKITDLTSNRITEPVLRKAVEQLPSWLRSKTWTYRKGEKYSMSDHPYGQLRGEALGLEWETKRLTLLIDAEWKFNEEEYNAPIPQSFEAMCGFVADLKDKREEERAKAEAYRQTPEFKRRSLEGQIHQAQAVTAVFGAGGLHYVTSEERAENVAKLQAELEKLEGGIAT